MSRLLVITSSYPQFDGDTAGYFVAEHVALLRAAGHSVTVLTWRSPDAVDAEGVERIAYAPRGAETLFYGAGAPENLARASRLGLVPGAVGAMAARALRAAKDADLIIGHWLVPSGYLARWVGRATGVPSLVIGHSGGVHALAKLPKPAGRRLARSICDGPVSVPSLALKEKLDRVVGAPSGARVLPMGFHAHDDAVTTTNRDAGLFMGRLVPIKAPQTAVRAAADAGVALHVAGHGPLRHDLEALAAKLEAPVTFHGVVTGEAKRALLSRCAAFVLPSIELQGRHEGLPVSVLEAAAAGMVPVLGRIPGLETLTPERWQRPSNAHEWAQGLRRAVDAPADLRNAVRQAAMAFAWVNLGPIWTQWIDELAVLRHASRSSRSV